MSHNDIRLHIFIFLLRVTLFVVTGIELHSTEASAVLDRCPGLWESMLSILCIKCIRLTLCPLVFKLLMSYQRSLHYLNVTVYTVFFVVECIETSQSLNTPECVKVMSQPTGHPMLAYINGVTCVYDGAYVLSHALFAILNKI
jgi:hypothetical protein